MAQPATNKAIHGNGLVVEALSENRNNSLMSDIVNHNSLKLLRAEFWDVEQLCEGVRSWDLEFQPLAVTSHPYKVGTVSQQRLGSFEVMHARLNTSIEQKVGAPANTTSFAVLGAGLRRLWWRGRDLDSETVLVYRGGSEVHAVNGPDFEVFTFSLSEDKLERLCEQLGLALPTPLLRPEAFRPPLAVLDILRRHLVLLAASANGGANLLAQKVVEQLVINWLDGICEPVRRPSLRRRDHAMSRCLDRLDRPDWMNLTPALMCEIAGVGERTLQYAFRERFGLTPAAFIKARRLASARRLLCQVHFEGQSVGDIAASHGFWHLSHFAADYRRSFGELPSETLKRFARD